MDNSVHQEVKCTICNHKLQTSILELIHLYEHPCNSAITLLIRKKVCILLVGLLSLFLRCHSGNQNPASTLTLLKCPVSVVNQLKAAELCVHKLWGHGHDCRHVKLVGKMEYKTKR